MCMTAPGYSHISKKIKNKRNPRVTNFCHNLSIFFFSQSPPTSRGSSTIPNYNNINSNSLYQFKACRSVCANSIDKTHHNTYQNISLHQSPWIQTRTWIALVSLGSELDKVRQRTIFGDTTCDKWDLVFTAVDLACLRIDVVVARGLTSCGRGGHSSRPPPRRLPLFLFSFFFF